MGKEKFPQETIKMLMCLHVDSLTFHAYQSLVATGAIIGLIITSQERNLATLNA